MLKKGILTSVRKRKHPKAGQNTQHLVFILFQGKKDENERCSPTALSEPDPRTNGSI